MNAWATRFSGAVMPGTPALAPQAGAIYMGAGEPACAQGKDGDVYFRTDTPGVALQRIYVRAGGVWVGIL